MIEQRSGSKHRALIVLALAAVFVLQCFLGYRQIDGPDVGFQLSLGRWILEHGRIPHSDPLTYTLGHRPYVDLQWIYQIFLWLSYAAGGALGVVLLNAAGTMVAMALVVWRSARREGVLSVASVAVTFLFLMGSDAEVRPHVFSWIYLNLVLLLLEEFGRGSKRVVWWLPVVMLAWANSHSLYPLGLAMIGAYGISELLEGKRASRALISAGLLSGLVTLINPYGIDGWLFPLGQLGMLQSDSVFKGAAGITEFLSPFDLTAYTANRALVIYQAVFFMQVYGVVAVVALLLGWRRIARAERIAFLLIAFVFWRAQKNHGYFVMATLPVVAAGLGTLLSGLRAAPALRLAVAVGTIVACTVVALQIRSGYLYSQLRIPLRIGHEFNEEFLPVRAARFLNENDVPPANMLNTFGDGGYLHFATGRPVFIDGRAELAGEEFFGVYQASEDPAVLDRLLNEYYIELAVFSYTDCPTWFQYFESHPGWRVVHVNGREVVYFWEDFATHVPEVPAPRAGADFRVYSEQEREDIVAAAVARRGPRWLETLAGPHYFPMAELRWTLFHLGTGRREAGLASGLTGLERGTIDAADLLFVVGDTLFGLGEDELAARCYRGVLDRGGVLNQAPEVEEALRARLGALEGH